MVVLVVEWFMASAWIRVYSTDFDFELRNWNYVCSPTGASAIVLSSALLCDHLPYRYFQLIILVFSSEAIYSCSTLLGLLVEIPQHLAEAL